MSAARPPPRMLLGAIPLIAAAALALIAQPAAAHEHVHVDPYSFVVGWTSEPAVVGSANGLDLSIAYNGPANSTEPVVGAAGDLTTTLSSGGQSMVKALKPKFGEPGSYTFDLIPTRAGVYTLRVVGVLNGTAVNFTVDLDRPELRSDLEFPVVDPTNEELASRLAAAEGGLAGANAAIAALTARVATAEAAVNSSAPSALSSAMMIGVFGVVLGAMGTGIGLLALRATRAKK